MRPSPPYVWFAQFDRMFLKRLDIQGFKTFSTRTVFDFVPGISAVVGPNGAGKSNIADAIRWALGEQNPRAVRCRHGEDVIFAGSSRRAPLGMAEVSLTFDNASGWLPIEYAEVAITRRAYRSGENEYLINGARVRLRDVADLLRRASLEAGGHVVVGQGVVDAVLSQRAEERRALVENLAGLRHYYVRRDEAEDRLRATETNLASIRAMIAESEPLVTALAEQATVARDYLVIRQELHAALRQTYAHQHRALLQRQQDAAARAATATAGLATTRESVEHARAQLATALLQQQAAAAAVAQGEGELRRAETAREESDRDLAVAHARADGQRRRAADLDGDLQRLTARAAQARREMSNIAETTAQAITRRSALDDELRSLATTETQAEQAQRTAAGLLHRADEAASSARRADEGARRDLGAASSGVLRARDEQRVLRDALDRAEAAVDAAVRALTAAEPRAVAFRDAAAMATSRVDTSSALAATARREEDEAHHGLQEARTALTTAEGRLALLQRWLADVVGTHPLLAAHRDGVGDHGVIAGVAESLRIPLPWQPAIAAALGPALQAAIVRSDDELGRVAAQSHKNGTARMATYALHARHACIDPAQRAAWLERCLAAIGAATSGPDQAIVGWATSLVDDTLDGQLVSHLLDGTLVVRDVATALCCRAVLGSVVQYATLSGDVLLPNGVLLCGRDQGADQLVESHAEVRRLQVEVEVLRAGLAEAGAIHAAAHAVAADADSALVQARREAVTAAENVRVAQADVSLQERLRVSAQQERARAARDLEECQVRAERLSQGLADLEARATKAHEARVAAEAAAAEARRAHAACLAERDAQRARHQKLASAAALARQEAATAEATQARAAQHLAEAERELANKESQREKLQAEAAALVEAEQRAAERRARVLSLLSSAGEQVTPARDLLAQLRSQCAAQEAVIARREGELQGLAATAQAADEAVARAVRELEALAETVEAELSLTLDALPEPVDAPLPTTRLRALRARLAEFGNVNLRAADDYDAAAARVGFLRAQASDLDEGIGILRGVIAEANASVREQFAAMLAKLEVSFASYFQTLFGGGSCALRATYNAEGMPLGVEVMAQPPGKRAQDLALLSGGERALVALALLFAMLAVHPVPFCLLDEVEAALDESNTGRFVEILRSLSAATQFVLITHNRGTMVQADRLYGITMSEGGISQVATLAVRADPAQQPTPGD